MQLLDFISVSKKQKNNIVGLCKVGTIYTEHNANRNTNTWHHYKKKIMLD